MGELTFKTRIECFSRGAKKVIFLENYSGVIQILKNNLLRICSEDDFEIVERNCFEYFKNYKIINNKNINLPSILSIFSLR